MNGRDELERRGEVRDIRREIPTWILRLLDGDSVRVLRFCRNQGDHVSVDAGKRAYVDFLRAGESDFPN